VGVNRSRLCAELPGTSRSDGREKPQEEKTARESTEQSNGGTIRNSMKARGSGLKRKGWVRRSYVQKLETGDVEGVRRQALSLDKSEFTKLTKRSNPMGRGSVAGQTISSSAKPLAEQFSYQL